MNEVSARYLQNWKNIFREIRQDDFRWDLEIPDWREDLFDFSNELQMRTMRERLVFALQTETRTTPKEDSGMIFGNKFFATMNEQQQRSFLCSILALPVRYFVVGDATNNGAAITIHTSALLDALANLNSSVWELRLENFALSNQTDVEALSSIILAKRETLGLIYLKGIECPIEYNKRDEDGPIGFLDPLLYASSRLYGFELAARTPPSHSSLVSTNAVRDLFGERRRMELLHLHGLGLNDSHCHEIAEALRTGHTSVGELSFESNPAISAQGYSALLGLISRSNVVRTFRVDDKRWEAELNLVSEMNRELGRLEYMTNGTFSSEERRWEWLQKLATMEGMDKEKLAARHVNYIWYTLRENPEILQT